MQETWVRLRQLKELLAALLIIQLKQSRQYRLVPLGSEPKFSKILGGSELPPQNCFQTFQKVLYINMLITIQ